MWDSRTTATLVSPPAGNAVEQDWKSLQSLPAFTCLGQSQTGNYEKNCRPPAGKTSKLLSAFGQLKNLQFCRPKSGQL
jgi:hypothetical protein